MSVSWTILGAVLLALGTYVGGNVRGYAQGQADAKAAANAQAVGTLTETIQRTNDAITKSNTANAQMRTQLAQVEKSSRTSSEELKNALAKNRTDPVVCRFDADSMRLIAAARDRAAERAASGVRQTVPATGRTDR